LSFTWDVDPVLLQLGALTIRYYGVIFGMVFIGGHYILRWQIMRGGGTDDDARDFVVIGVVAVLVGSRLGHVIFYEPGRALRDPLWIFMIWKGGLASHGATIGLILGMFHYASRKGQTWLECSDRFSFAAALGATLVRAGNFVNSEIVGRVTDGTWGVRFPRYDHDAVQAPLRHPSQLYEVGLGLAVLGSLWVIDRAAGREERPRGLLVASFCALYFTGRFFVEWFKEYQTLSQSFPLTMGQCLSIPAALAGWWGIRWSLKRRLPAGWVVKAKPKPRPAGKGKRKKKRKRK